MLFLHAVVGAVPHAIAVELNSWSLASPASPTDGARTIDYPVGCRDLERHNPGHAVWWQGREDPIAGVGRTADAGTGVRICEAGTARLPWLLA
jgi:hypothetical protein